MREYEDKLISNEDLVTNKSLIKIIELLFNPFKMYKNINIYLHVFHSSDTGFHVKAISIQSN